eukprot:TRINITY_DN972_c0_g1_i1.p1 TRINITY_DN972_c0_g1~~TRINITY_DN972_c0_g1_i1.p1  ORF type:complete len:118 (-),score=31.21 TRINITY_DN972_c0_g1_i1:204-557(-)
MKIVVCIALLASLVALSYQTGGVGQYTTSDLVAEEKTLELMQWGLEKIAQRENSIDAKLWKPAAIKGYSTQVVHGINHKFIVECKKPDGTARVVEFVVNEIPWEDKKSFVSFKILEN